LALRSESLISRMGSVSDMGFFGKRRQRER
jgi:hypothetical protein